MEVKINKEIREFSESIFFGLSLRQFCFSILAMGVAVGLYFLLRDYVGNSEIGWICIVGALPFAAVGFFKYHGMRMEEFIAAWIRSEFLIPKRLIFQGENIHIARYRAMAQAVAHKKTPKKEAV